MGRSDKLMAITYDEPNDTVTVTAFTKGTPCNCQDVLDEDVSEGWGFSSKQGDAQYLFEAKFIIGNDSDPSWFADELMQIELKGAFARWSRYVDVKTNGHFRLGAIKNLASKTTENGCSYYCNNADGGGLPYQIYNSGGEVELYASHIFGGAYLHGSHTVWGCILTNLMLDGGASWDVYRVDDGEANLQLNGINGVFEDLRIYSFTNGVYKRFGAHPANDITIKGLKARNGTYITYIRDSSIWIYLINADVDNWTPRWTNAPDAKVLRQCEFDAHCRDINGDPIVGVSAVAVYLDESSAFNDTTDGSGNISMQTVDHGYFDQANGSVEQVKAPLKVTYSKDGYQPVPKYYDMIEKTKDTVTLLATPVVIPARARGRVAQP